MKLHEKLSRTKVRTHIILENKVTLNKTDATELPVENSYYYYLLSHSFL